MSNVINLDFSGDQIRVSDKAKFCPKENEPRDSGHNIYSISADEPVSIDKCPEVATYKFGSDLLRQVIDDLEGKIGDYELILNERLDLIGQLAWHAICVSNPLDVNAQNLESMIKKSLRDNYPTISNKHRKDIFEGVKWYLYINFHKIM